MKIQIARIARVLVITCSALIPMINSAVAAPPSGTKWTETFVSEFRTQADLEPWSIENGTLVEGYSRRDINNVIVDQGNLHLNTRFVPDQQIQWSTAFISTKEFRQRYGYFEAKIMYGNASGLNNAFWLMSEPSVKEGGQEIDINEGHYPNKIEMTVHTFDKTNGAGVKIQGSDLSREWHIYGLSWTQSQEGKSHLIWYFDGRAIRAADCDKCHTPVRIILSTAVLPRLKPDVPKLNGSHMEVAWVKAYREN